MPFVQAFAVCLIFTTLSLAYHVFHAATSSPAEARIPEFGRFLVINFHWFLPSHVLGSILEMCKLPILVRQRFLFNVKQIGKGAIHHHNLIGLVIFKCQPIGS